MNNNYTSKEKQILLWVSLLASSQGYYGRLYEELKNNKRLLTKFICQQSERGNLYLFSCYNYK